LQSLTLISVIGSFFAGILLVINRLNDFRKTAELVKNKKEEFEIEHNLKTSNNLDLIKFDIIKLKKDTDLLGKKTWKLLYWQVWTFLIGTILGAIYMLVIGNISIAS
jgi:hypothetical protein